MPALTEGMGLTKEALMKAYPTFYGAMVWGTATVADAEGKQRMNVKFYPYAVWDAETEELVEPKGVSRKDGTFSGSYFIGPGSLDNPYTDHHKLCYGLKQQKVGGGGDPAIAIREFHEGWFKRTEGNFSTVLPTSAPKNAIIPDRPTDFDPESWVAQYGTEDGDAEPGVAGRIPDDRLPAFIAAIDGVPKTTTIRRLTGAESGFNEFDVPTLQGTIDFLLEEGRLRLDDGKYTVVLENAVA